MNYNKAIKNMTKKELLGEYNALRQQIDDIGCYGIKDLIRLEMVENEIDRRGYAVHASYIF